MIALVMMTSSCSRSMLTPAVLPQEALQSQQQLDIHEHLWHNTHPPSTHGHIVQEETPQPASLEHDMLLNLDITSHTGLTGTHPESSYTPSAYMNLGNLSQPEARRLGPCQPMFMPCIT